jgi:hypothetical protein
MEAGEQLVEIISHGLFPFDLIDAGSAGRRTSTLDLLGRALVVS